MKKIRIELMKEEGQLLKPEEEKSIIQSIVENECEVENIESDTAGVCTVTINRIGQRISS